MARKDYTKQMGDVTNITVKQVAINNIYYNI